MAKRMIFISNRKKQTHLQSEGERERMVDNDGLSVYLCVRVNKKFRVEKKERNKQAGKQTNSTSGREETEKIAFAFVTNDRILNIHIMCISTSSE